jgi:S1-C subfamily serine protease
MDYTEIIKKVKPSIAMIVALDSNNQPMGTGSGFVFFKKNILVTCNHVVRASNAIFVKFPDSEKYDSAKVVLRDDEHDLALLKFDDSTRLPLVTGDYNVVMEGMTVVFSGYPFSSQDLTTHQGIISAIIKDATGITSFLIDGTVNSGNSGCPLMNSKGEVIGVINAKRRLRNDLLEKVEKMTCGAISLHGVDLVEIYQVLSNNVQLGVGMAVPVYYIPEHREEPISHGLANFSTKTDIKNNNKLKKHD